MRRDPQLSEGQFVRLREVITMGEPALKILVALLGAAATAIAEHLLTDKSNKR
jgi:DNA-binding winged helix-turn-helix (wHTH) protein